jgi:hypothetical protein
MTHPMTLIDDGSLNGLQHITFAIASEIPIFVVCVLLLLLLLLSSSSSSLYRKTPSVWSFFVRVPVLKMAASDVSLLDDDARLILTSRASTQLRTAALSRIQKRKKKRAAAACGRVQTLVFSLERKKDCWWWWWWWWCCARSS